MGKSLQLGCSHDVDVSNGINNAEHDSRRERRQHNHVGHQQLPALRRYRDHPSDTTRHNMQTEARWVKGWGVQLVEEDVRILGGVAEARVIDDRHHVAQNERG